jgi:hypothetical protein
LPFRSMKSALGERRIGKRVEMRERTRAIIQKANEVLSENHPMTVRQVFYQCVAHQVIENKHSAYQAVSNALVGARKNGIIPWEWIEDRLRKPRQVSMWSGLPDFADTVVAAYRRDVWATQKVYVEVWLEKDALSGIFEDILEPYGVTLNVGRGYDGWSSKRDAAMRYNEQNDVKVLYFGDFDPSGVDTPRALRESFGFFEAEPEIITCALTKQDIEEYNLPFVPTKKTDPRSAKFIEKHGDMAVELDALPDKVLKRRIKESVEAYMDLPALRKVAGEEKHDKENLRSLLNN